MESIKNYLKRGLQKAGTSAALGRAMGVSSPSATRYLTGQRIPETSRAIKLARFIEAHEYDVVIAAEIASSKDDKTKDWWLRLGKALAATAGLIALGVVAYLLHLGYGKIEGEAAFLATVSPLLERSINYTNIAILAALLAAMISRQRHPSPIRDTRLA